MYCRERDDFEVELTDLKKKFAYLEAAHETMIKERDDLNAQVGILHWVISNDTPITDDRGGNYKIIQPFFRKRVEKIYLPVFDK